MNTRVFPEAFLAECKSILGDEYPAFRAALEEEALHTLRLNPAREGAEALARAFIDGEKPPVAWEPLGRYVRPDARPGRSLAHECGAFYLQDASAMAPVAALDPRPGERVLDLCAAPGGKSGQIAARMRGEGFLLSNEIDFSRARALMGNLERLGVQNAFVASADASALARALPGYFDAVLVDAPCSGEGMFRRDPDALAEWTPASPAGCAARQREILRDAARLLRPSGRLVYSTCTFNRAENEETVAAFLTDHPEFRPAEFELSGIGASSDGCLRLWPHRIDGEGHFVARLERACAPSSPDASPRAETRFSNAPSDLSSRNAGGLSGFPKSHSGDANARVSARASRASNAKPSFQKARSPEEDALSLLTSDILLALPRGRAVLDGDALRLVPPEAPPEEALRGIRLLRAGLPLARVARGRVEPEHALAMALSPSDVRRFVNLSDAIAARFLEGEAIPVSALPGWTLVCWNSLPLGWGKSSDGILKNHLPKGLRKRGGHTLAEDAFAIP